MTAPMEMFTAEYPCERHCVVEFDVTDVNAWFTHNQMRRYATDAHDAAHKAGDKVFTSRSGLTVRAAVMA